ncbi:MAG: AAA family ATPase [Cytophagales bacterium]|nr:AAA family ATPase [Cytophagales bacterium]
MYIREINIKNYKRFKEFHTRLDERFTLLAGGNGTGKTSLLDACGGVMQFYFYGLGMGLSRFSFDSKHAYATIASDVGDSVWRAPQFPIDISGRVDIEGRKEDDVIGVLVNSSGANDFNPYSHDVWDYLQSRSKKMFDESFQEPLAVFFQYAAIKPQGGTRSVSPSKPFIEKRQAFDNAPQINLTTIASWMYHFTQRSLQEKKEPLIFKKVKEAVLTAIHAEDIDYIVRSDSLEVKYKDQGWRPFDELSDGQQRLAAIFCDLALRCASINSHLGENCIRETTGVVTIDELDLHLHPKWQRDVIPDLLRTFPKIQFIAASHSPFLLQAAFDNNGKVVDMATGEFMDAPDTSIEDIAENNMGVKQPQRGTRFIAMKEAAQRYYELLERVPAASEAEKAAIKSELNALMIPYANDPAYAAFLEMHRVAAGV